MKIKIGILFLTCLAFFNVKAQTPTPSANLTYSNIFAERIKVGGGTTPITSSALIEANSTNKGILLPRMTNAQMLAIPNPVRGLIVYNTDNNCLYVRNATTWVNTCANLSVIEINWNSVTNKPTTIAGYGITDYNSLFDTRLTTKTTSNIAEGSNLYWTNARGDARYPQLSGSYSNPSWITTLDKSKITGLSTTYVPLVGSSQNNILIGNYALGSVITGGANNIALGSYSMYANTIGTYNIGIGENSLTGNETGVYNIGIGINALSSGSSSNTIAIGRNALMLTTGSYNIGIGYSAGSSSTGSSNIFIGGFNGSGISTSNGIYLSDGNGNRRLTILNSGNTGISQNSPSEKLDVSGNIKGYHIVGQNNIYDSTVVSGVKRVIKGDDLGGSLLLGTSTTRLSGDILSVTFTNAYSIAPYIILQDANDNYASGLTNVVKVTSTTTGFTLTVKTGLSLETSEVYKWNYYIKQ